MDVNLSESTNMARDIFIGIKFKAYLKTTLQMTRKSYCIKRSGQLQLLSHMAPETLIALSDKQLSQTYDNDYSELYWAIDQLLDSQSRIIKLYYFEDLTDKQIAERMNVTRQAIGGMKRRALKNLREALRDSGL